MPLDAPPTSSFATAALRADCSTRRKTFVVYASMLAASVGAQSAQRI